MLLERIDRSLLLERTNRWEDIVESGRPANLRVMLLGTFTLDDLVPFLGTALEDAALPAEIRVGPYDSIAPECLSDDSESARFQPHLLVCFARLEDMWGKLGLPLSGDAAPYVDAALSVVDVCVSAVNRRQQTLLYVLPAIPEQRPLGVGDAKNVAGVFAVATKVREAVRNRLAKEPRVLIVDAEEDVRSLGVANALNPRLAVLAHIPYTQALFCLLGDRLARMVVTSRRAAKKLIVVDGDNTLWGGVLGEDGANNVDLADNGPGEAFKNFQSYLLELRRAGVLIALCSKNQEDDVWSVFSRRDMRLRKEHLCAWRVGWQRKSEYIREMAVELGIGLDAIVFIDDNPVEIAEVRASTPEVSALLMPKDPAEWGSVFATGVLDRMPPTPDDLERADFYGQDLARKALSQTASSPEEYLAQLAISVSVFAPEESDMARLSQLIAKTNQFNLNGRRRTEAELASLCKDERYRVRLVRAKDRFGDYGVVGAMILALGEPAEIDTFVMSCRSLGRGVEAAMIADLFAALRPGSSIMAKLEALPRNEPAQRYFKTLGCDATGVAAPLKSVAWPAYVQRE